MADDYPLFDIERILAAYLPAGPAEGDLCMSREALQDLARRGKRSADYRARMEHLAVCSQCWEALHSLQTGSSDAVTEVVALQDTGGPVRLPGNRPQLATLRKPAQAVSKWIDRLLTDGFIEPARSLQTILSPLKREQTLMLAVRDSPVILTSPINTAIRTHRPQLRWQPLANVEEYRVVLMELSKNRTNLVWNGSMSQCAEGVLPPEIILATDRLYLWQVVASGYGIERRSSLAWFAPLSAEVLSEVAQIEQVHSDSALILLGAYERYGLYEDGKHQIERLKTLNANNELVSRMEQQLLARQNLANLL